MIITQNVDALHEAGGTPSVLYMHGTLARALCSTCNHRWAAPEIIQVNAPCPACHVPTARPDVLWFGETPYHMDEIFGHLANADLFAATDTSG